MAIATYYGANYTVVDNTPSIANLVSALEWGGNVQVMTDTFTAGSTDTGTAGSFIYIGKLKKHSIPLMVTISTPAALTWTGTIGWSGDPDALGDFAAVGPATVVTGPAAATQNTKTTQDQDVYILTATAAIVSADSISTSIFYVNGG